MKFSNIIYVFIFTISLVGCGGGGSPGIKNESANGVWVGFSTNNQAVSSEIVSVYYDDKYVTLNTADQKLYTEKDDIYHTILQACLLSTRQYPTSRADTPTN
mgnify:CR=1 FL=1